MKKKIIKFRSYAFWIVIQSVSFISPLMAKNKVKLDGYLNVGTDIEEFRNGSAKNEARLKLKIKRQKGLGGVVSVKGSHQNDEIDLQDAYISRKKDGGWLRTITFGLQKKRLGLEYERSSRERLEFERSLIYQKLEGFAFVGRETQLRMVGKNADSQHSFSLGYAESNDAYGLYGWQWQNSSLQNLGYWVLIQADKGEDRRQLVWCQTLSWWTHINGFQSQLELFSGIDPLESDFNAQIDKNEVYFYAWTLALNYLFPGADGDSGDWQPLLRIDHLVHDAEDPAYHSWGATIGTGYIFEDLKVLLLSKWIRTNSRELPDSYSDLGSGLEVHARLYF